MAMKNAVVKYAAKEDGGTAVNFRMPMTEKQIGNFKEDIKKGLIRNCSIRVER
jgi:hypothetical protein